MGRRASYHWDKREQCYRSDAGGRANYFRGIARDDHAKIATAFAEFLEQLHDERRPEVLTVQDVCLAFVAAPRGIKPRTIKSHKDRLLVWMEWSPSDDEGVLAGRPMTAIEPKALKAPLRAWADAGWSDNYRAGIAQSVKAAFAWAASEDGGKLIPENPFAGVKVPSAGRSPERYAERREVAAYLRYAWRRAGESYGIIKRFNRNLVLMIRVAAHTGARPGELCAAWWDDFDDERGTITLPPDRHKTGGKTKKNRVIYLTPGLVRALERERNREGRHPVSIFVHKRSPGAAATGGPNAGEPWGHFVTLPSGRKSFEPKSSALSHRIRKIREAAVAEGARLKKLGKPTRGLEFIKSEGDNRFVLYQLRHTTASDHLMNGGDVSTVAQLLGTSSVMIETTYGHLLDDHLSKASERLTGKRRGRGRED